MPGLGVGGPVDDRVSGAPLGHWTFHLPAPWSVRAGPTCRLAGECCTRTRLPSSALCYKRKGRPRAQVGGQVCRKGEVTTLSAGTGLDKLGVEPFLAALVRSSDDAIIGKTPEGRVVF